MNEVKLNSTEETTANYQSCGNLSQEWWAAKKYLAVCQWVPYHAGGMLFSFYNTSSSVGSQSLLRGSQRVPHLSLMTTHSPALRLPWWW